MSLPNTNYGRERVGELLRNCKSVYFLGIGGINMSSLARMTKASGFEASGYDRAESSLTDSLEADGIKVYYDLNPSRIDSVDAIVYTVAISDDNPEYLRAVERKIPIISRADYLGYIMCAYRRRIGISGMHGKSTATAMVARIFELAEADPTVLSGAVLRETESPYRAGGMENFIFEACEYKDSFLDFYPTAAVVLNIDLDHLDYFEGIEHIRSSFGKFIGKTGNCGLAVLNFDNDDVRRVAEGYSGRAVSFGIESADAEYRAVNIAYVDRHVEFDILHKGSRFAHIVLRVTGKHSVIDSLAAAAVAAESGISAEAIALGLGEFLGAHRRMEMKGKLRGVDVYDDYAHHPEEIKCSLEAAKKMGYSKIHCVFQPHTYSRTKTLYDRFVSALSDEITEVTVADIYAARETDTLGMSAEKLAGDLREGLYFKTKREICEHLKACAKPGECIIIMGAGDIYTLLSELELENGKI